MSITLHFEMPISIENCIDLLVGRNPILINFHGENLLSWDSENRNGNNRYGVIIHTEETFRIDKGHTVVWNGQMEFADLLENAGYTYLYHH